jgi:hypothetical protein
MINKDYLYEKKYKSIDELLINPNCTYFYSRSSESRSYAIVDKFNSLYINASFIEIEAIDRDIIIDKNTNEKYDLRSSNSMMNFINTYWSSCIYIDTSGMNNRTVASLLRNAILLSNMKPFEINILYVEPYKYKIEQFKLEGVSNDLAEKFDGIEPLPGFISIVPNTDDFILVAFLGFEGGRFTYLIEQIQPQKDNIIAVVGVPGFRIEYPFIALWGNRISLEETKSWENIKYVAANSLVDAFLLLKNILAKSHKSAKIVLAPIGTKPHAIGAILFAIKFPNRVEIVYDNPKRKINRTDGTGQIVICNVNSLLRDELT